MRLLAARCRIAEMTLGLFLFLVLSLILHIEKKGKSHV